MVGVDVVERDLARVPDDVESGGGSGGDEVAGDLGLAVGGDVLAGRPGDVDRDDVAVADQRQPVVEQPLRLQPRVEAEAREQVGECRFEDAGADARLDPRLARAFDDDAGDLGLPQRMAEEQPGGPGTDDGDLGFHPANCFSSASSTR